MSDAKSNPERTFEHTREHTAAEFAEDPHRNLLLDSITDPEQSSATVQSIEALHPADFSDQLEQLTPYQREDFIERRPELITPDVLAELEDEVVEDILPLLPSGQIAAAITELDNDDATQIIEEMDSARRSEIFEELGDVDRANLEASLQFEDETVGRLMQREFVAAPAFWSVGDTIDHMRATGEDLPDVFFNVYVVDPAFHPVGYVNLSKLMRAPRETRLSEIMDAQIQTIEQEMDQEDAAYIFEKYNLISAPVTDAAGRLCGMMTVDDILTIIKEESTEDILALAGVSDAGLTDTAGSVFKSRAPWLFVNLLTAILASLVIARFDYAITEIVALAVLMPIVASMGGNAGTQALTVAVRALSDKDLTSQNMWRTIRREGLAAMLIGIVFAIVLAGITYVWFGDMRLAGVAFFAMIINHVAAGLAGILVPLSLKRMGADPAVASSVFVTTVTDVVGFFAFLGFAATVLL
ncbi:MAG: magnesium transporter [Maricaulaceae bacterium]